MARKLTAEQFISRAQEIHGPRYDYSCVEYKNSKTKVKIICPEHGIFEQAPSNHLLKQGCPLCSSTKKITLAEFIKQASKIHSDKYDYSYVIYKNNSTKVKIICPEHGIFEQRPKAHLSGQGCPKCAGQKISRKKRKTEEDFINEAQAIHNNQYNYKNISFKNMHDLIKIECPLHGVFEQTADNHISKKCGCPACAEYGFNPNKPATLYYLLDQETGLYKIGVTNKSVSERFPNADGSKRNMIILEQTYYENGYEALEAEQEILEAFSYCRCTNESWPEAWGGRTEFFKEDILLKDKICQKEKQQPNL